MYYFKNLFSYYTRGIAQLLLCMFFLNNTMLAASEDKNNLKQQKIKKNINQTFHKAGEIIQSLDKKDKSYAYTINLSIIMLKAQTLVDRKIQKLKNGNPSNSTISDKLLEGELYSCQYVLRLIEDKKFDKYMKEMLKNKSMTIVANDAVKQSKSLIKEEIQELEKRLYKINPWHFRFRWVSQHIKLVIFLVGITLITIGVIIKFIKKENKTKKGTLEE